MSLTVGRLAKLTGLTVRTLHHWDAIDLLKPSHRSEAGYRLYARNDLARLYRIVALRRLGMPLADIARALHDAGATLPDLVDRQLDELDARIEQASGLRTRLRRLRDVLAAGDEPTSDDWLSALELVSHYDRGFSDQDLAQLMAHRHHYANQWPPLIADVRLAMERGTPPEAPEAQDLGRRWRMLMLDQVGGDVNLAIKLKLTYSDRPDLQARTQAQTGLDATILGYVTDIWRFGHRTAWARHLDGGQLARLQVPDERMFEWVRLVSVLREQVAAGANARSDALRPVLTTWRRLLDEATSHDLGLRARVEDVLHTDDELQAMWALDAGLLAFVDAALAHQELETFTRREAPVPGEVSRA